MELVLQNPFRVLGLPVEATDRQIAKRVADAEIFLEMGKPLKFDGEFPWMPPVERSLGAMRTAQGKLHRQEDRCFYAMFWFHAQEPSDKSALGALERGDLEAALDHWRRNRRPSSAINRYVLHFAKSGWNGHGSRDELMGGLAIAGQLLNSIEELTEYFRRLEWNHLDLNRVVLGMVQEALTQLAGTRKISEIPLSEITTLMHSVALFPREGQSWLEDRFVDDCRSQVEIAVSSCKRGREASPKDAVTHANMYLGPIKQNVDRLRFVIQMGDPRRVELHDQVATELLRCSIDYHNFVIEKPSNDHLPLQPAVELAKEAEAFALGALVRSRIQEGLPVVLEHAEDQRLRHEFSLAQVYRSISTSPRSRPDPPTTIDAVTRTISTLPKAGNVPPSRMGAVALDVETFIVIFQRQMKSLRTSPSMTESEFIKLGSENVNNAISLLIEFANSTKHLSRILSPLGMLEQTETDKVTRDRLSSVRSEANRMILGTINPDQIRYFDRSLAKPPRSKYCYIATCVYGSDMAPEVVALRRYRDEYLSRTKLGRMAVSSYYQVSPYVVPVLSRIPIIHRHVRWVLNRIAKRWILGTN